MTMMKGKNWILISLLLYVLRPTLTLTIDDFNIMSDETRLIRILLNETNYLKKVRPSHKVTVDIRLVFNQIVSMVEKEQIIVSNCFVDQKWTGKISLSINSNEFILFVMFEDPRLTWNPNDFHNITWLRIPATSVWYTSICIQQTMPAFFSLKILRM
jgi:hypothetical protein